MRSGLFTVGAVAVVSLAACSSSGGGATTPTTPGTTGGMSSSTMTATVPAVNGQAFCGELRTSQKKLSGLASGLGNPAQAGSKLDPIISELQKLKADAPAQLQTQFGDLIIGMQDVKKASSGTNLQAIAKELQKIAPKLQKDGSMIENYLKKNCAHS